MKGECWIDREISGCEFRDARLGDRFRKQLTQIAIGQSIPLVCQDWANTKAAYRFFSNDRVSEADILAGHFQSTLDRAAAAEGLVLVLHDTTEFSYQREKSEAIGTTNSTVSNTFNWATLNGSNQIVPLATYQTLTIAPTASPSSEPRLLIVTTESG